MFDSFLVALRVVIPMALLMGIGALIRRAGVIDRPGDLQALHARPAL